MKIDEFLQAGLDGGWRPDLLGGINPFYLTFEISDVGRVCWSYTCENDKGKKIVVQIMESTIYYLLLDRDLWYAVARVKGWNMESVATNEPIYMMVRWLNNGKSVEQYIESL